VVFHLGHYAVYPKVEAWMVVIIVTRELGITGLRMLAASKNVVLAAERYGKHKTISQIVAIIALLVMDAYGEWWRWLRDFFQSVDTGVRVGGTVAYRAAYRDVGRALSVAQPRAVSQRGLNSARLPPFRRSGERCSRQR